MTTITKITLNVNDVDELSNLLYDMLAKAFWDKAERMGLDPAKIMFDEWTIETTIEPLDKD